MMLGEILTARVELIVEDRPPSLKPLIFLLTLLFVVFPFKNSTLPGGFSHRYLTEVSPEDRVATLIKKAGGQPTKEVVAAISRQPARWWRLLVAVAMVESSLNPRAISRAGAVGLMQINPKVWGLPREMLFDPEVNVLLGRKILEQYLRQCHGNLCCALRKYSGGAIGYCSKVMRFLDKDKK